MDNEWKDLNKNTPIDILLKDEYVIGEFIDGELEGEIKKECVVKNLKDYIVTDIDYRYRLKPLEPIAITLKLHDEILAVLESESTIIQDACWYEETITKLDGRPVKIIE